MTVPGDLAVISVECEPPDKNDYPGSRQQDGENAAKEKEGPETESK
jgi:hypothetical protein